MVALPSGKQRCIHGPAVNVPSKLDSVCTVLPRLPSQSELIPLKLKRKLAYKGHYLYDYVTTEKILNALKWLKVHNPLYVSVEINEEWAGNAESNDHELYRSLINSIDIEPELDPTESTIVTNNTSNHARGADSSEHVINEHSYSCTNDLAFATSNLEDYARDNNFIIHDVAGDGNCLYNAVLYQLESNDIISTTVKNLRQMVATYLNEHADTYMPFVASPIASDSPYNHDTTAPDAIDGYISTIPDPNTSSILAWERYLERLRSGSWGDHVVIAALANMFNVTINVIHARPQACSAASTSPNDSHVTSEVNLVLLMQYHFVGLDKQVQVATNTVHSSNQQTNANNQPINTNNQPTNEPTCSLPLKRVMSILDRSQVVLYQA